jgi:hypothetical protein
MSALTEPGYLLSPTTSIIVGSYLSTTTIIKLLAKSPKIANATLRFDYWATAQAMLERLVGLGAETDSRPTENEMLCPRLSELRLNFEWKCSEWAPKKWLLDKLNTRRRPSIAHPLSIYVGWKGEGTYMLLTSD